MNHLVAAAAAAVTTAAASAVAGPAGTPVRAAITQIAAAGVGVIQASSALPGGPLQYCEVEHECQHDDEDQNDGHLTFVTLDASAPLDGLNSLAHRLGPRLIAWWRAPAFRVLANPFDQLATRATGVDVLS